MTINTIIVDDEKSAIIALRNDLTAYCPSVRIAGEFTRAADALEHIRQHPPGLIFLDIDMPVMNGFDFVKALPSSISAAVVFVSAYSEFAVRAFKVNAVDYLLKPVIPSELEVAVQKALAKQGGAAMATEEVKGRIVLPVNDGYNLIDPAHIIYCKAAGAYTEIVMDNDKSFLISKTLGRTQELMPADHFERVHQSYLINLHHVKKFRKGETPSAVMVNNDVIKVSRLNKDRLAQLLGIP
jgi:two-component system, LytTR family, response regulator